MNSSLTGGHSATLIENSTSYLVEITEQNKTERITGSCYSGITYHIAEDHIHTDLTGTITERSVIDYEGEGEGD